MNIDHCIDVAVKAKEITKKQGDELKERFAAHKARRAKSSPADAEAQAKADLSAEIRAEAREKKRRAALAAAAVKRIDETLPSYRTPGGRQDIGEATIALLENYGGAGYTSLHGAEKALTGTAMSMMSDVLKTFDRKLLTGGTRNRARLDNVVRQLFGEETGDAAARELAASWTKAAEFLRARFNRAGGSIGQLDNWGLPQSHNPRALLKAGRDAWKSAIRPMLDVARMRHPITQTPILPGELDTVLDQVWGSVVTNGWNKREPAAQRFGKGSLATQHTESRFLIFKDADTWLAYQRDFGQGDPFATMMLHVKLMARDVAALETLGPNPDATIELLKQRISKAASDRTQGKEAPVPREPGKSAEGWAEAKIHTIDNMWRILRGAGEAPVRPWLADLGGFVRNWTTASVLGAAWLPSLVTDPLFQMTARRFAGLKQLRTYREIAGQFASGSRDEAVRAGLILDSALNVLGEEARFAGTQAGPEWSRRIAERVLTFSGLSPWTQAGKHAFGMGIQSELADRIGRTFAEIEPPLQRILGGYGIDAAAWDVMRGAGLYEPKPGAKFLRPNEIAAASETIAERYLGMILQETEYAIPSGTVRGRAMILGNSRAGTLWGEFIRSAAMFKSFGLSLALLQGARIAREATRGGLAAGGAYAGSLAITMMLGGALSIWMKDLASGRDLRPILGPDGNPMPFFAASFLQGGGVGIWGDFLFADLNRFGGGIAQTASGPVVQRTNDLLNLSLGNLAQLASGDDTQFWEEARKFVGGNVPGGTLWYLRLGYNRVLLDQLEAMIDPNANRQFKSRQRFYSKNFGNDSWWRPGQMAPDRGPNLDVLRRPGG